MPRKYKEFTVRFACLVFLTLSIGFAANPVWAADALRDQPPVLKKLLECRTLTDREARLACYDAQVAAVDTAVEKQDLVVADRAQVQKTRKSLFGLSLPSLAIFGANDKPEKAGKADEEGVTKLSSTITSARQDGNRKWFFVLEDGAKWAQIDTKELSRDPKPGMKIEIKRAAMGSFLASIDGQISIRVRREN